MPEDFAARIVALAERTLRIKTHCAGEEATRIYLVMPFLELLGYDAGDPSVIVPEHEEAINFAIMAEGAPVVALEATGTAQPINRTYERLRAYSAGQRTVRLAIATNGVVFEAYTDSQVPNVLDDEPFVRIDLEQVAANRVDGEALDFLMMMRAEAFNPDVIAEKAFACGVRDRLKACLLAEFRNPSEAFCVLLLEQIGIRNARTGAIDQHYRPILKTAMEHAIVVPVVQALRHLSAPQAPPPAITAEAVADAPITATAVSPAKAAPINERIGQELAAFGRLKRRSA